jgi:hypothetical protein
VRRRLRKPEPAPWVKIDGGEDIFFRSGSFSGDRQAVRATDTKGLHFTDVAFVGRLKERDWQAWLGVVGAAASIVGLVVGILFGLSVI